MGGGVSLGAFEAGAIAEMVRQFEEYNLKSKNSKYVVDVLAGASAGSMTLALLGREILQCPAASLAKGEGRVLGAIRQWGKRFSQSMGGADRYIRSSAS
jgi:predicted acylesterase/phospholipase RssA